MYVYLYMCVYEQVNVYSFSPARKNKLKQENDEQTAGMNRERSSLGGVVVVVRIGVLMRSAGRCWYFCHWSWRRHVVLVRRRGRAPYVVPRRRRRWRRWRLRWFLRRRRSRGGRRWEWVVSLWWRRVVHRRRLRWMWFRWCRRRLWRRRRRTYYRTCGAVTDA